MSLLRPLARSAYLAISQLLRFEERLVRGIAADGAVLVLNLHSVSPERNDFYPPLSPQAFDDLIVFLQPRFSFSTFADLANRPIGRPTVILSFDDGFHDFVEYAMPILERRGVAVNHNVIASSVLTGTPPWTQRLNDLLAAGPRSLLAELRLPGFELAPPGDGAADRVRYGAALVTFLMARSRVERAPLLVEIERFMARGAVRSARMMDVEDVRTAARSHEIGAHSYAHDSMQSETIEFFRDDLGRCDDFFRQVLGRPFTVYAFPNGAHRPEQIALLEERGVRAILLVGDRYADPDGRVFTRFNLGARDPRMLRLEALGMRARPLPF